jgi:hypothetical protein
MNTKTTKILYWVLLVIFCLFHIADGLGGIMKTQAGIDAMNKLGMPTYLMPFLGTLKVLGVIALIQNKFKTVKEWAFAGFAFTLMGAAVANACAPNSQAAFVIMPIGFLVVLFLIYYCWRKLEAGTTK